MLLDFISEPSPRIVADFIIYSWDADPKYESRMISELQRIVTLYSHIHNNAIVVNSYMCSYIYNVVYGASSVYNSRFLGVKDLRTTSIDELQKWYTQSYSVVKYQTADRIIPQLVLAAASFVLSKTQYALVHIPDARIAEHEQRSQRNVIDTSSEVLHGS